MALITVYDDNYYMKLAMQEAQIAFDADEVPIGAVLVYKNQIIAKSHNQTELLRDVTAHAEILSITSASSQLDMKYLKKCSLYVSLEPCIMCAGALRWSQLGRLVYAAEDRKQGFMRYGKELLHPKTKIQYGLMKEESEKLLQRFFQNKRQK
ncbi:MAG: nucleoside deaminase [Saprospiraceae bacterium]|jgi:tRNA(adenine34) deaminase|nr:nucleoside deaminase [Saprospiraceae bacterium]